MIFVPGLSPSVSRRRTAFTLVEMLVVITIIGVLAGLAIPAVMRVMVTVKNSAIKVDISQLEAACQAYKSKYGEYPPDGTDVAALRRHIRKVFPRCTNIPLEIIHADGTTPLNPFNSLTFWLGGYWSETDKKFIGFSADPTNPFNPDRTIPRTTPFFEFDPNQVVVGGTFTASDTHVYSVDVRYWPKYTDGEKPAGAVAYLRADDESYLFPGTNNVKHAQDTDSRFVMPAQDSRLTTAANNPIWINPKTFQIFSSGLDGKYGYTARNASDRLNFPSGDDGLGGVGYAEETYDDITNFSDGTLEDSMP